MTTPKLYLFHEGKYKDLNIAETLALIQKIRSQAEAESINETILADIINRARLAGKDIASEL